MEGPAAARGANGGNFSLAFSSGAHNIDAGGGSKTLKPEKIPQSLVLVLDSLCSACPKKAYTEKCPFQKFQGISSSSRKALFEDMDMERVLRLFSLATDCSCPKDPSKAPQRAG